MKRHLLQGHLSYPFYPILLKAAVKWKGLLLSHEAFLLLPSFLPFLILPVLLLLLLLLSLQLPPLQLSLPDHTHTYIYIHICAAHMTVLNNGKKKQCLCLLLQFIFYFTLPLPNLLFPIHFYCYIHKSLNKCTAIVLPNKYHTYSHYHSLHIHAYS